jgi:hypothetical protein
LPRIDCETSWEKIHHALRIGRDKFFEDRKSQKEKKISFYLPIDLWLPREGGPLKKV